MTKTKTANIATGIEYLTAPLTAEELAEISDSSEDGAIEVVVGVPLAEIADTDFEGFMDILEGLICEHGIISDICYVPVGVDADTSEVLVKVDAFWEE